MAKEFIFNVKVYYEDTDAGGVVYYANYLKYLERARTELIYKLSLNHKVLNKVYNTYIVVGSCNIQYRKTGFFEDQFTIYTKLIEFSAAQFKLSQNIKRNKELIVSAEIQLVTVNNKGKPIKIPNILINKLEAIK
tara:strand:+ start:135 stop:539 length:405 start_codon:yes stop_codon:yes gene_type:complete